MEDRFVNWRERIFSFFLDRRNQLIIGGMIVTALLFLTVGEYVKAVIFVTLLQAANYSLAYMLRSTKRLRVGFELILLSTVLCGIAYGSKAGMMVGALSAVVNYAGYKRVSSFSIVVIPLYMLIGLTAFYFRSFDIAQLGVFYAIMYNLLMAPLIVSYMGAKTSKCLWFASTNILFNYIVFAKIGPILLNIMA